MADESEGFFARWSRRKRGDDAQKDAQDEQRDSPASEREVAARAQEAGDPATSPDSHDEVDEEERQRLLENLPDIESLTEDSDFTAFMQKGVPDDLRNRALRKLWRMNPIYANLDGLNDYDGDYTDAAMVVKDLKSAYRPGLGYLFDNDREKKHATATTASEGDTDGPEVADSSAPEGAAARDSDGLSGEAAGEQGGRDDDPPSFDSAAVPAPSDGACSAGEAAPQQREEAQEVRPAASERRPRGLAARRRWGGIGKS